MFSLPHRANAQESTTFISLREITSASHSRLRPLNNSFLDDDTYQMQYDDDDLYISQGDKGNQPREDSENFGRDTSTKAAEYASNEIYVEDMWGELVKAEPGQLVPSRRCIPRIPDQSIPDTPGQSIPNEELSPIDITVQFGSMLKNAAHKLFGRISQHIELQRTQRPPPQSSPE